MFPARSHRAGSREQGAVQVTLAHSSGKENFFSFRDERQGHTRPLGLVWIVRGTPYAEKSAWGSPQNPYQTLIRARSPAGQERGWGRANAPPPEPYQAACPQHGGVGALGRGEPCGPPPTSKHLVPMLMRTRAYSRQPWPLVVGVCGRRAYRNTGAPFNLHRTPTHSPREKCVNKKKKTQYTGFKSNLLGSSAVFFRLRGASSNFGGVFFRLRRVFFRLREVFF
ncbi:hypothetical protein AB205_0176330 [Aquarana catesbeiana]|uniref:Uncharacterized protein n=1 Tax=Aquarana catesbeiana TaxID=8400 RepID=A0A2G9Q801_AQUCT|nr:hypothetical protein AB205_0176330 [Aquarana catesbeiana]